MLKINSYFFFLLGLSCLTVEPIFKSSAFENQQVFSQVELSLLTESLQGKGCTLYRKGENQYFISIYKEVGTFVPKNDRFRITQIKASHQSIKFLVNREKRLIEYSESGTISESVFEKKLTEFTPIHCMIIENEAKNHTIYFQYKQENFYVFYAKL